MTDEEFIKWLQYGFRYTEHNVMANLCAARLEALIAERDEYKKLLNMCQRSIAVNTNEIIEQCAKVADVFHRWTVANAMAAKIRALKQEPKT